MNNIPAALWSEALKARRSKVFIVSILFFLFVGIMMGMLTFVAKHPEIAGRSATMGAKASAIGKADWPNFLDLLIQAILALGSLGYGIVTSWVFGREYSDRVIKDLLALPVPRSAIVAAKFIVVAVWCVILSLAFFAAALVTGWIVGLSGWTLALAQHAVPAYWLSALLTVLLCTPVAFVASASRGYLLPIGFVILVLIITQLVGMALPGLMLYFPWAIPALCSGMAGSALPPPEPVSLVVLGLTSALGYWATVSWWDHADQV